MKPMPISRVAVCLLAVLTAPTLSPSLEVFADEGRIPIYAPTTITQSGTYIVTRDFCFGQFAGPPCTANGTGIDINANDVVVDLNGHTLNMQGSNAIGDCINIQSADQVIVERNSLEGCANALSITGTRFQGRIVDNNVLDAAGHGMNLLGLEGGQVLGNRVKKFAQTSNANGIWLSDGGRNLVQGNVITASGTTGANSNGILLDGAPTPSSNNVLRENTVTGVPYGIRAYSDENRLERNVVTGGSQTGVWIGNVGNGARTMVEDNQILSFAGCGLFFVNTLSHVYRNNVIRNNGGGSDVCGFAAPITNGGGNVCTAACP